MTPRVLHVAKVSGISGSENHLLLLLPALREHGFDIELVMLHEGELGAAEFAARLESGGVPVERVPLGSAASPLAFRRLLGIVRERRPDVLHTHLVHADFHGLVAGRLARVPVLVSTKHGFNAFRDRRVFAVADRAVGRLADVHIAISKGLARYLAEREGFDVARFEIVHYGIEPGPPPPHAARGAAACDRRQAHPDQGARHAPPGAGGGARRPTRASRSRSPGRARSRGTSARP